MQEINEELENDRSVLEWMLGQYVRAKRRKKQLEIRLLEINAERDSPIGGQGYDPLREVEATTKAQPESS